jgi:RNA polymerase sigma-70 factor (ECF subfamily)
MALTSGVKTSAQAGSASANAVIAHQEQRAQVLDLRELVASNLEFIWRSLRRLGVRQADADDAAQQVFLTANEKLLKIKIGSERAFLLGIAIRVASHVRRGYQRREAAHQRLSSTAAEPNPTPEELTEELEARKLLDRVLDEMSEELRVVFVLFELEELSTDEMAALLALPRGTVASRLRRAREIFHDIAKRLETQRSGGGGSQP